MKLFLAALIFVIFLANLMSVLPAAAEPSFENILDTLGFTESKRTPVQIETFPAGKYNTTLYAEYAGYRDKNRLTWYTVGTNIFNLIYDGPEGILPGHDMGYVSPPLDKTFISDSAFGLCLMSPDGNETSQKSRNPDGKQHMKIYQSVDDPNLFLIGCENMNYPSADFDYQDMVFSLKHTQAYLTVNSVYDSPTPTSGWLNVGTSVTVSVTSPVSGPTGTRYVCTGWTGTGDVPTSGSNSAVGFTITQDSSVTWNWKTQYLLTVSTDPSGLVPQPTRNPLGDSESTNAWWYDDSVSVTLTAQSVTGFTFAYWDVDGNSQGDTVNPITVSTSVAHVATACYTPLYNLVIMCTSGGTTHPVPGTYSHSAGSTVHVDITADNGYVFDHWEFDAVNVGSSGPYSVQMNADHTLKAFFKPVPVGGEWVPISKTELLTPWISWASLTIAIMIPFVYLKRRMKEKD